MISHLILLYFKEDTKTVQFTNNFNSTAVTSPFANSIFCYFNSCIAPNISLELKLTFYSPCPVICIWLQEMKARKVILKFCFFMKEVMEFEEVELF